MKLQTNTFVLQIKTNDGWQTMWTYQYNLNKAHLTGVKIVKSWNDENQNKYRLIRILLDEDDVIEG